jgi:hypothetical protein
VVLSESLGLHQHSDDSQAKSNKAASLISQMTALMHSAKHTEPECDMDLVLSVQTHNQLPMPTNLRNTILTTHALLTSAKTTLFKKRNSTASHKR